MLDPKKLQALNTAIGHLVIAALNPKNPDIEAVFNDFRHCLSDYDSWAESFWTGAALDVGQVFKVGNDVSLSAPKNSTTPISAIVASCPAGGSLTLVHMFEAARFVPIGNTPVMLEALIDGPGGDEVIGEPVHAVIGPSGILEVPECWRGQRHRITFYPNVSRDHVKALYASYQTTITELEDWLRSEWTNEFQPLWASFSQSGFIERYNALQQADQRGVESALLDLWDDIQQLYHLLADLQANSEKLLEYMTQAELETLLNASTEAIANGLLVLSDEPLLFIYLTAVTSWLRMLPPQYEAEVMAEIRTGVLIGLLLACVTGPMGIGAGVGAKVLGKIKSQRARQWLAALSIRLAQVSSNQRFSSHADALKPLMVSARKAPLAPTPRGPLKITPGEAPTLYVKNPAAIARDKSGPKTRLSKQEHHDNAPDQAKNPNGDSADSADKTATHSCPVSMVTGEELLTLTDGELDGVLPFAFTRLYRTSAVEIDSGLGFGWSHSLAHRLEIDGDNVVWIDHENRRTRFPGPSTERPAIHNSLSRAAIYLGDDADELILAQAGETTRFYHFCDGNLTAISDPYNNRLRITRDRQARIKRLDNGAGRALLLCYDRRHLIAVDYQVYRAAANPDEAWHTEQTLAAYRYDDCHRLIEATNAAGESERYDYDNQAMILQRQLAGGASFFWEWEREGKAARCVRHWASFAQMDARYVWDDNGSVTVHNADGSQEVYVHDQQARLVRKVEPEGAEHLKAYDDNGRLVAEKDPLGGVTQYTYNDAGRLLAVIPPEDEPTYYEYHNGFVRVMRRGKARWKYQRNIQGDITEQIDPDGHITHYQYDNRGQLLSIRYPDNSCHFLVWNNLGQLTEEQLPDGGRRCFAYDALGRLSRRQDAHGAVTRYQWDVLGRLIQTTLPGGVTRAFSYNAYGKLIAERDESGQVTRYEYADDLHLVSRRINADGSQLRYRYDNARLLLSEIENEVGEKYQLAYGANGLIEQETGFDGRRTAYRYDLNGHLLEKTEFGDDGSTLITAYQRDAAGRLLVKTLPDGQKVDYRYDSLGRLVSVDDGHDHPLEFEYDQQDRLITEHQGWGTLRYRYNACGQLDHLRLPDNSTLDYHHAKGGALTAIDLNGTRLTTHVFDAGREQQRQQGQLLSRYHYDEQGRLHAHAVSHAEQPRHRRDYAYSANGNLDFIADSRHGQRNYRYDLLNRLVRVRHSRDPQQESFAHDPAGNLQMQDRPGLATIKGNRLLLQGDRHYDYDAFGNLIFERRGTAQKLVTEYRYDCQHRLIGVTLPDGRTASYRYDAFGRRIAKTVDGHTTEFFWQGDNLVAESSKKHYRSYLYEPGSFRPLAMLDGKGPRKACPFYYQLDHLGTPQELTDYSGEIVWSATYKAYGKLASLKHFGEEQLEQPLRFQGQYFDAESGLHYNRHRYYNPDIGRYLTPDPSKLAGGLNGYQYTPNPTGWVDPLGLNDCPGAGKCKKPGEAENPAVDEGDPAFPSRQPQNGYLFRGDSREPWEIFDDGFQPLGDSIDLYLHAMDNRSPPSFFVSTTKIPKEAVKFATGYGLEPGFIYVLKKVPGIDVNKKLGLMSPHRKESEVAIPGGIDAKDIVGVTPVNADGSHVGYSVLNPNRE
ncbi:RHS repeat-associated core domain-containing protein [Pseudomonas fluorescens]|uniref:RHS repeat-associated core domain-containing protein n=1 Tax=Pseudomonas fluorescens TaxID=294 RepID=UPI003D256C48